MTTSGVVDTSPDVQSVLIDGYRRMGGHEKFRRVASLNRSSNSLGHQSGLSMEIASRSGRCGFDSPLSDSGDG